MDEVLFHCRDWSWVQVCGVVAVVAVAAVVAVVFVVVLSVK